MKAPSHPFRLGATALLFLISFFLRPPQLSAVEVVPDNPKGALAHSEAYINPTNGLGSWIWASNTFDMQTCKLWKTFDIPESGKVAKARLVVTADNEFTLFLDGRNIGRGVEWRELYVFDLSRLLLPGRHVLVVECYNGASVAGMVLGLRVDLADGRKIEVKSDESWRVVPDGVTKGEVRSEAQNNWPSAITVAPLGSYPWWKNPDAVIMMPALQPTKIVFWQSGWVQITLLILCGLVILISLRLMAQLALHQKERLLLQQERARIAREIHDDIGSRMTQLVLNGEVAQNGLPDGSETQEQLGQICDEARQLLSTMDEILWAINPQRDTVRDFEAYVCKYAQEFLKPTPIQCLFEVDSEMSAASFNLPLRRSLLMAIKEALNNAVKHSQATELSLQIQCRGNRLRVAVQDNGSGFDPSMVKSGRNGLSNLHQRMLELGGSCRVTSQPDKGCRVEFNIPLENPKRRWWPWTLKPRLSSKLVDENRTACNIETSQTHDPAQ